MRLLCMQMIVVYARKEVSSKNLRAKDSKVTINACHVNKVTVKVVMANHAKYARLDHTCRMALLLVNLKSFPRSITLLHTV